MKDSLHIDIWQAFAQRNNLTEKQLEQFKAYADLLQEWSAKINLTALTDLNDIVSYHFQDSIDIVPLLSTMPLSSIADVGAGAGFPGIPIKIMRPDLKLVLIEVNNKKVRFMELVAQTLGLDAIEFVTDDWRTFLRMSDLPVDLFLARASLQPKELIRIFKPSCLYKNAQLVYWASQHWRPDTAVAPYVDNDVAYKVGQKIRRYVFFRQKK